MTRLSALYLATASVLAFAAPAAAKTTTLYASDAGLARSAAEGRRVSQVTGVTQIRLENGGTASFVAGASFQIREDGSIDLFAGTVTIASGDGQPVIVHLADRGEGRVSGKGAAASFSVDAGKDGRTEARGHVLTGSVTIVIGTGSPRTFTAGQMWNAEGNRAGLAVANGAAAVPAAGAAEEAGTVQPMGGEGGQVAAAVNGLPVVLGDALAAAGASGDVVAAARRVQAASANPSLESYPSGDLALLVAYAGNLNGAYGGRPFNGAAADIIRTYLQFLSTGGAQANFLTAYAGFMVQYLDLVRSGALPSSFRGASLAQINSFISYRGRTAGFGSLSGQNQVLVDAYLAFILGGGNADQFLVRYTDLTNAYFAFIRGGGTPTAFTGASQATITAYLTFLRDAGLLANLSAQNRALLSAYLTSLYASGNGMAWADQYRVSLNAYYIYLQQGRLPSTYTAADLAALRRYLETLKATGLFDQVLGSQASFFNGYLVWLQGGGAVDGYTQLPANIFAGYATALSAYYEFLKNGGVPSGYTVLTQEQIRIYLAALESAGATARFTGDLGTFWSQYFAWISAGNNANLFAGLPTPPDYPAFATALNAYYAYLAGGGLPSGYSALTLEQLRAYINALIAGGRLGDLGANASFLQAYFTYLGNGGTPNGYAQLPVYLNYQTALTAYYTYLQGGGLPSGYTALTPAQLQAYLQALIDAGVYSSLFSGQTATFLTAYYNFVSGGGSPNAYSALPAYTTYVSALNAYFVYLQGGGVPGSYTGLTLAQLQAYLQALIDAGILGQFFTGTTLSFFQGYYTYVSGGGAPNSYSGLASIVTSGSGTGGSGTGTGTGTPALLTGYTGGFNANAPKINMVLANNTIVGGEFGFDATSYTLNSNGGLTSYVRSNVITRGIGTNTVTDIYGNANAVIGRWSGGSTTGASAYAFNANQGLHYLMARPLPTGFTLPTTGTVNYTLIAATKPTIGTGTLSPGTFDARLALAFGSTTKIGFDGTITMPQSGSNLVYSFTTPGGAANPAQSDQNLTLNGQFFTFIAPATDSSGACANISCVMSVYGLLAGGTDNIGITYVGGRNTNTGSIAGAAIFAANGAAASSGSGSGNTTQAAPAGDGTWVRATGRTNIIGSSNSYAVGSFYANIPTGVVADADGQLQSIDLSGFRLSRVTATNADYGTAGGAIGWARWAGGTVRSQDNTLSEIPANGGMSFVWGKPVTNMPTSGTVNYQLAGSTKPTLQSGASAPGTLNSAAFSVNFGTMTADFSANVTVAGNTYTAANNAPMTITANGAFQNTNSTSHIFGFLAGPGASHAGVSYNIFGPGVSGVIAFAKPGT
ncbi:hypothetical protein [Novosphingobium sp. TH158]|uniref:hypothetical protein n=1 Tax=Novosphingobium sp. TH158 TaxID=2067455 RepID=UPI000C7B93BB|nr:hypothetical protein [Novosphingobium sp. TH158]PLK26905.1 hypothetical protein C0V78_08405 [Novosphingobium sp. TH158]